MTQVCYENSGGKADLTVMGHCDAGRINGMDLCCCAVSMLTYTAMEALGAMQLSGFRSSYGGGWCHICFDTNSADIDKAVIAIDTLMKGYALLARSYPDNVTIKRRKHNE